MDYQERVNTREDIKTLYEKVLQMPHVKRYRGYTNNHSYGWDECADDYIRRDDEFWFENPGYDPERDISESESKAFAKIGESIAAGYASAVTASEAVAELKKELDIMSPSKAVIGETDAPRVLDSGHRRQFESGAVRDICEGKGRCDLLPLDVVSDYLKDANLGYIANFQIDGDINELLECVHSFAPHFGNEYSMLLEVAKQFEDGAKKYGDSNWQKGIPVRCYIDSAVRHYLKYLRGDKDEPHDRAFCWNILCCIWTCIHKPELNDYAPKEENTNE